MKLKYFISIASIIIIIILSSCLILNKSKSFQEDGTKSSYSSNDEFDITSVDSAVSVGIEEEAMAEEEIEVSFKEIETGNEVDGTGSGSGEEIKEIASSETLDPIVEIKQTSIGKISYSIPDTMTYYKTERVVLRITKNEIDSILTSRINTTVDHDFVLVNNVRVANIMSAELVDLSVDKSFEIKELSSKEQNIEDLGYTEWQWSIKPLKSGEKPLKLIIKVLVTVDGRSTLKDIPVFEKEIYIYSKPLKSFWNFFTNYWQWLFITILIPLFKYLYDKFKKKKSES